MGRLFWKFFMVFWLAFLTAGTGVGATVWLWHKMQAQETNRGVDIRHSAHFVRAASAVLTKGGVIALKDFLNEWNDDHAPPVIVVNERDEELLGRRVSAGALAQARQMVNSESYPNAVREIAADDGHRYLLFLPAPETSFLHRQDRPAGLPPRDFFSFEPSAPPRGRPPDKPPRPILPIIAGTLTSLIFSALLAWYFAKPIRHLRSAFDELSKGHLHTTVAPLMGNRRDELADLGRHFDNMAGQIRLLMDAQRRLLHDVSHELRSPLARMQAAIGLACQQPEKTAATLHRIERESQRMSDLIGELLMLSRLEGAETNTLNEEIEIGGLLDEIVEDARFEAESQRIRIEYTGIEDVSGQGSGELIHRAVENVLRNAVQHTAPETSIAMTVKFDHYGRQLFVTIDDQGRGVPEEELTAIFEPFFRGSQQNKRNSTGLGLAIARRAVELHGGKISAANRREGGLRVEMSIFLARIADSKFAGKV